MRVKCVMPPAVCEGAMNVTESCETHCAVSADCSSCGAFSELGLLALRKRAKTTCLRPRLNDLETQ